MKTTDKIVNTFITYNLTEEEALRGAVFSYEQKRNLHNQRALVAEEKLRLSFDPSNPQDFMQQEAYKRGQLELLDYLIESSDAAEAELTQLATHTEKE